VLTFWLKVLAICVCTVSPFSQQLLVGAKTVEEHPSREWVRIDFHPKTRSKWIRIRTEKNGIRI